MIPSYDLSYILYNVGLIHTSNGEHMEALKYYFRALERNLFLPRAFNNMVVICHYVQLSSLYKEKNRKKKNKKGFLHIHRLKLRFLSTVEKKEATYS